MIRGGVDDASFGSCLLHVRANDGEEGDEVVEGLGECGDHETDGKSDDLHPSPIFPKGRDEGGVFSVFRASLSSHPKSLQKPILARMRIYRALLSEVGSGEEESGYPLA